MTPYLKIDHISKTFARGSLETEVLKDITLGIAKGEYVSIIGHSGCGKTTLLNIVAGLTPVTTGGVLLENREVNEPGPDRGAAANRPARCRRWWPPGRWSSSRCGRTAAPPRRRRG